MIRICRLPERPIACNKYLVEKTVAKTKYSAFLGLLLTPRLNFLFASRKHARLLFKDGNEFTSYNLFHDFTSRS